MTKSLLYSALIITTFTLGISGCAEKQLTFNKMICPAGHDDAHIKADFSACRYYDLKEADKASVPTITIECKECLEKKGYKIINQEEKE
ncbi:MAG: hypothetical protein Q8N01_02975 [Sulfuricurvum sp.]|nr:hypothetical protein [Sulfuricurvum sp.]MDP3022392.1 hypothetical protein [Sulfuricurvum sp.]MDP3119365.1 hypothetical protein [Sulfuricurvum sp.]